MPALPRRAIRTPATPPAASSRTAQRGKPVKGHVGPSFAGDPDAESAAHSSAAVGARLRFLRDMHGLSQRELARRAGLTHATIGAIERDAISPSIGSMLKIVESFPITMSEFFAIDPTCASQVFFRAEELREGGSGGISVRQVGHDLKGRPLQVLLERYEPGAETADTPYSHPGEEGGVVIEGRLEVTVGGSKQVLGPGDGYLFSSRLPHKFRNVGGTVAVVVCANTPPL